MAEFCKECFMESIITSAERKKIDEGKMEILKSDYDDFCEGCEKIKPIVLEVKDCDKI